MRVRMGNPNPIMLGRMLFEEGGPSLSRKDAAILTYSILKPYREFALHENPEDRGKSITAFYTGLVDGIQGLSLDREMTIYKRKGIGKGKLAWRAYLAAHTEYNEKRREERRKRREKIELDKKMKSFKMSKRILARVS